MIQQKLEACLGRSLEKEQIEIIRRAHEAGGLPDEKTGKFTSAQLRQKAEILSPQFSKSDRRLLMEAGAVGFLDDLATAVSVGNLNPIGNGINSAQRLFSGESYQEGGVLGVMKDAMRMQQSASLMSGNNADAERAASTMSAMNGNVLGTVYHGMRASALDQEEQQRQRRAQEREAESASSSTAVTSSAPTEPKSVAAVASEPSRSTYVSVASPNATATWPPRRTSRAGSEVPAQPPAAEVAKQEIEPVPAKPIENPVPTPPKDDSGSQPPGTLNNGLNNGTGCAVILAAIAGVGGVGAWMYFNYTNSRGPIPVRR